MITCFLPTWPIFTVFFKSGKKNVCYWFSFVKFSWGSSVHCWTEVEKRWKTTFVEMVRMILHSVPKLCMLCVSQTVTQNLGSRPSGIIHNFHSICTHFKNPGSSVVTIHMVMVIVNYTPVKWLTNTSLGASKDMLGCLWVRAYSFCTYVTLHMMYEKSYHVIWFRVKNLLVRFTRGQVTLVESLGCEP